MPVLVCPPVINSVAVGISQGDSVVVRVDSLFPSSFAYKCGPISIYGRKTSVTCNSADTVFSRHITFCLEECADEVMVEIIAKNDSTGEYSTTTCMVIVQVQEQLPPDLVCRDSVIILGADSMATIDSMVLLSLLSDKSGIGSLTFTGSGTKAGSGSIQFTSNGDGTFGKFDCTTLDTFQVTVIATDIHGNSDSCMAELIVIDTSNLCPAPFTFIGSVVVDNYMGLRHADLDLFNQSNTYQSHTDVKGRFEFNSQIDRQNLTLAIDYQDEWITGITANDLYHLQNHITGYKPVTEPHFLMSSDVNADGQVDLIDLLDLKKILLGISSPMTSEVDPWLYMSYSDLVHDHMANRYNEFRLKPLNEGINILPILATKRGDLDGDIVDEVETRSIEDLSIRVDDYKIEAGQEVYLDISWNESAALAAQFEFILGDIQILSVEGEDVEIFSDNEVHRVVYYKNQVQTNKTEALRLHIRTSKAINLQKDLKLSDNFDHLVFDSDGEKSRLQLTIERNITGKGEKIISDEMLIVPNPIRGNFHLALGSSLLAGRDG